MDCQFRTSVLLLFEIHLKYLLSTHGSFYGKKGKWGIVQKMKEVSNFSFDRILVTSLA